MWSFLCAGLTVAYAASADRSFAAPTALAILLCYVALTRLRRLLKANGSATSYYLSETRAAGCRRSKKDYSKLPVTPWKPFMACFPSHFMTRATL